MMKATVAEPPGEPSAAQPAGGGSQLKKVILTVIQILVTAGILFWVFHDPAKRAQMGQALHRAITINPEWLLAGFLSYGVVEFLAALQLRSQFAATFDNLTTEPLDLIARH